jgi:DNA mismatch repair ATPase MutS
LFATHFHGIADIAKDMENLACYCTDVAEDAQGSFAFIHKMRKGVNRRSHALKVATLAGQLILGGLKAVFLKLMRGSPVGLPQSVINTAKEVLQNAKTPLS